MKQEKTEAITKAAQCADLLVGDLREAHKQTSGEDSAREILLRNLVADAVKIRNSLDEFQDGCS